MATKKLTQTEEATTEIQTEEDIVKAVPVLSDAQMDSEVASMRKIIEAQPQVRVKINASVHGSQPIPVGINGCVFKVETGKTVSVPEAVANLLEKGGYI